MSCDSDTVHNRHTTSLTSIPTIRTCDSSSLCVSYLPSSTPSSRAHLRLSLYPLHRSIIYASTTVLDHILEHDECDVDLQNKLQRDTPLHLAVKIEENGREGLREYLGQFSTRPVRLGERGVEERRAGVLEMPCGGMY